MTSQKLKSQERKRTPKTQKYRFDLSPQHVNYNAKPGETVFLKLRYA